MRRSYKFLLRPTTKQAQSLTEMLRDHCTLYNAALQERRDAWRHASKTTIRYGDQSAQLKEIRAFDPDRQGRWSFSSQQATLRRLDKAFAAFFRRVKDGQKPGYPRFRGVGRFDTVEFPKDGDGCGWDSSPHDTVTRVRLKGVGHVRVHQHRPTCGRVKTIEVKREGKRWYVVLACDDVPSQPLPPTGRRVGVDMGVTHFLTTSEGEHIENLRFGGQAAEQLNIAGMTRTPRPKADPDNVGAFLPNGARTKAGLNRSILDAAWSQFLTILADKAESAGRQVIGVNARNTSRTCPKCGHVAKENRITQAQFRCTACRFAANADHVAAVNIAIRAGLVRPAA